MNPIQKLMIRLAGACMFLLVTMALSEPTEVKAQVPNCTPNEPECATAPWIPKERYVHLSNGCWVRAFYRVRYCEGSFPRCQIILDYVQKLDVPEICLFCDPLQYGMTVSNMLKEIQADIINRSRGILPCNNDITRIRVWQPLCWQHGYVWYDANGIPCFGAGPGCVGVYQKYTYYPCSTQACCRREYDVTYNPGVGITIKEDSTATRLDPPNAVCTWPCEPVCP